MVDGEIKTASAPAHAESKFYVAGRGRFKPFLLPTEDYHDFTVGLPCPMSAVFESLRDLTADTDLGEILFGPEEAEASQKEFFWNTTWKPAVDSSLWLKEDLVGSDHTPMLRGPGPFCYDVKVLKQLPKRLRSNDKDLNDDETRAQALNKLRMVRSNADQWPEALRQVIFRGEPVDTGDDGIQFLGLGIGGDDAIAGITVDSLRFHPDYIDADGRVAIQTFSHEWGLEVHFVKGGLAELGLEGGILAAVQHAAGVQDFVPFEDCKVEDAGQTFALYEILKGGAFTSRMASIADVLAFDRVLREGASALVYEDAPESLHHLGRTFVRAFARGPEFETLWAQLPKGPVLVWVPPADAGHADGYYSSNRIDLKNVKWFAKHAHGRALFPVRGGEFGSKHALLARALACDQLPDASEAILDMGLRGGHILLCKN